jgi:hypothetical protein
VNENECKVGDEQFVAIHAVNGNCDNCAAYVRFDHELCQSLGECLPQCRQDERRINWQQVSHA